MIDIESIRRRFHSDHDNECTLSVDEAQQLLAVYEAAEKWHRYYTSRHPRGFFASDGANQKLAAAVDAARKAGT